MELIIKILVAVFIGVLVYLGVKVMLFKKGKSNNVGGGGEVRKKEEKGSRCLQKIAKIKRTIK